MTDQMPIVAEGATLIRMTAGDMAPPFAPLAMPKQVLQSEQGFLGRAFGLLLTPVAMLKHGFRRVG